jgi:hypothetical protein
MSGVWERLLRVHCADCGRTAMWAQEPLEDGEYPNLEEAQRSARHIGWRSLPDGWRCPNCPNPMREARRR